MAKILNDGGYKTPAYFQKKLLNKNVPSTWPDISKQGIWLNTTVKRILKDEIYTGTLINHKTETNHINKTFKIIPPDEQYRHENFVPALITRELWEHAQFLLADRPEKNVRSKANQKIHRYTGLIRCEKCGRQFIARKRKWKDVTRVEYTCNSYHRYGKQYCSPNTIREETLDELIFNELKSIKWMAKQNWQNIERQVRAWSAQKSNIEQRVASLTDKIAALENEIDGILMERIHDKANAERYDRMLAKRENNIVRAREQIADFQNMDAAVQKKKAEMKHSIDLLDEIIVSGGVSDAHLRMLVDKILVGEDDGKLEVEICLKAAFMQHYDVYNEFRERIESYGEIQFVLEKQRLMASGEITV